MHGSTPIDVVDHNHYWVGGSVWSDRAICVSVNIVDDYSGNLHMLNQNNQITLAPFRKIKQTTHRME